MIAKAVRLVESNPDRSDVDASLSVPVLKAALEVGRQDRLWLKQKLTDRKSESDALREELQGLTRALPGPSLVDGRPTDQPVPAMTLATQLRRRLKSLWEERERLVSVLQDAARERDDMAQALKRATHDAQAAARRANQAVLAADAAARERDALAAQLERQRDAQSAAQAAMNAPAAASGTLATPVPPNTAEVDEIARTLEIMATALGDLRQRIEPLTSAPVPPPPAAPTLDERLAALLAPLAALPELQAKVGGLSASMERIEAGLQPVAKHGVSLSIRHRDASPLAAVPASPSARPLLSIQALERALLRGLPMRGFPADLATPLLAAWLAGAVPMVSGIGAVLALHAAGRIVAADRTLVVPVDPAASGPAGLFDGHSPDGGSALADFLSRAKRGAARDGLSLVVLEGLTQATIARVATPLFARIVAGDALDDVLSDDLAHDARYAELAAVSWPANVLLAASLDTTAPAAALSPDVWAHGLYIALDDYTESSPATDAAAARARLDRLSFVPAELWSAWTAEVSEEAEAAASSHDAFEVPAGHHEVVRRWRSVEAALAILSRSRPAERGASILLEHAILPWSLAVGAARLPAGIGQRGNGLVQVRRAAPTPPAGGPHGQA